MCFEWNRYLHSSRKMSIFAIDLIKGRVTKEVRKILIQKMYGKIKHSNGDQSSSEQER